MGSDTANEETTILCLLFCH